jgi:hypothetical protein
MSNKFCGSFGINTKVGFAPSGGIDDAFVPATKRIEVLRENLQFSDQLVQGKGITGSINPITAHLRNGQRLVSGGIAIEIGPNELAPWIRALCGNTAANQTKDSFNAIAHDFTIQRDLVTHGYRHCIIQQAVIRGRSNPEDPDDQIMQLAMSFIGIEEVEVAGFPAGVNLPTDDQLFWLIGDSKLTVAEDDFPVIGFDISIRNMIQPLFRNRLTPGCFRSLGRDITLEVQVPYSPESATAMFGENDENLDVLLELVSDNLPESASNYATSFNFPTMRRVEKSASTRGRGEIPLEATFRSFQMGAGTNMSITNAMTA